MEEKDYVLSIYGEKKRLLDKQRSNTMFNTINNLVYHLYKLNCLDCIKDGQFITTKNPFTGEEVCKRFVVHIHMPETKFIVYKLSKGSIDMDAFVAIANYLREKMNEGI